MKTQNILTVGLAILAVTFSSFAIDNLQISVPSANAVLIWPSLTNETYVIQYRNTLNSTDTWTTLSGNLFSTDSTNVTSFTDPNTINLPIGNYGVDTNSDGGGGIPMPGGTNSSSGGADTNVVIPGTGFYRVLGVRVIGGVTNGATVSDYLNIATRPDATPAYLNLMVNGQSFPNEDLLVPPFTDSNSVTFTYVDTAYLTNGGPYNLQVEGSWVVPAEQYNGSGYEQAYSQPVAIYVTNELSYPNWDGDAGDGWASFDVQSAHPAVDWEIDIYNYYDYLYWYYGYTDSVYPIQIATGSTTNGMIDYVWNLTDLDGNVRTNLDNDPDFFSFTYTSWTGDGGLDDEVVNHNGPHPNGGDSGGSAEKPNPITQNDSWPSEGGHWVVAYQDMFRNYYDNGSLMSSMLTGWLDMGGSLDGAAPFYQTPTSGTNAQTFPLRFNTYDPSTVFYNTNSYYSAGEFNDIELLNLMLHDSRARNFYGYGHGHADQFIGLEIAEGNLTPMHRYRFVWLDGCLTANGSWDRFFHINGPGIYGLDHYQAIHKRPAAFMGHTEEIPYGRDGTVNVGGVSYAGTIPQGVPFFRSQFVFYWWLEDYSLRNALSTAISTTPAEEYPIIFSQGRLKGTEYNYGDYIKVEGYDQMGWDDYNDAGDVP